MSTHDHAAKAASLLRTLNAIGRGEGPIGTTSSSRDMMAREALTESVLALNETLNRIFPAEPDAEQAPQPASGRHLHGQGYTVWANGSAETTALAMIAEPDLHRADPANYPDDEVAREMMSHARLHRDRGFKAVIVDAPTGHRLAVRFDSHGKSVARVVRPAEPDIDYPSDDPADVLDGDLPGMWSHSDFLYGATDAAEDEARIKADREARRQHLGIIDLTLDDQAAFLRPETIPADDWKQIVSAATTARALGSVGAKSVLPGPEADSVTYEVVFRTEVSDDKWQIKRTTPVGDVYRLRPEASA